MYSRIIFAHMLFMQYNISGECLRIYANDVGAYLRSI